jgi:thioredoxin-like negative regulator of GroEL
MGSTNATVETFHELARTGNVLLDVWGPECAPCIALMPAVEELGERYAESVKLLKLNAPENRKVCRDLRVAGLPAYITLRDGVEVERLTGNGTTIQDVESAVERLLAGAPTTGLPEPAWKGGERQDGAPRQEGDRAGRA